MARHARLTPQERRTRLREFVYNNRGILLLMLLLFAERLMVLAQTGIRSGVNSDDVSYINSGINFIKTGVISMHDSYPSAQIMPGMTVFIGLMSLIFGEGDALWLALKLVWIVMGTFSAYYTYKSVCLFTPHWCGIAAAAWFLVPNVAWMDNLILTETPFILFSLASVYYTFEMGRSREPRYFWRCALAFFLAFMLKANYGIYPVFAAIYLLLVKYDFKTLIKQGLILGCVMLAFLAPWTIRNYIQFHAFIPLTYGAGNPALMGTYQGYGYPTDEELDYETNVYQVVRERYADYYGSDGEVLPQYKRYINLLTDEVKAEYRQQIWREKNPGSMRYSYLIDKPRSMIHSSFYWSTVLDFPKAHADTLQELNLNLCVVGLALSFLLKKRRAEMFSLTLMYMANIYIYAMTFSFDRYAASLLPLRYIMAGIGLYLICQGAAAAVRSVRRYDESNRRGNDA